MSREIELTDRGTAIIRDTLGNQIEVPVYENANGELEAVVSLPEMLDDLTRQLNDPSGKDMVTIYD